MSECKWPDETKAWRYGETSPTNSSPLNEVARCLLRLPYRDMMRLAKMIAPENGHVALAAHLISVSEAIVERGDDTGEPR